MLRIINRLAANKLALIGGVVVVLLALTALLAPIISPYDYEQNDTDNRYLRPFQTAHTVQADGTIKDNFHLLGTDELGRDILSRIIYGSQVSLMVAVESVLFAFIFGSIPAILAGYFGGWVETVVMRIVDVLFSIPSLILALSIVGITGRSMFGVAVALGLAYIPVFARVTFSAVVAIRDRGYVEAAKALGTSPLKILVRDIFPNILPIIMVQSTASISWAILAEAGLGFIGLGVNPPTPSWGLMLSKAREYIFDEPYLSISPGIAILITVFAFNMFGDGLRDLLDPRAWQPGE